MAKPKSKPQLSLGDAHVGDDAAGIPDDHWSRRFFEHIYCRFDDAQFAGMYEDRGRYPISPSLLACVTILQYMFKVSDRLAVDNTVMRRDWRVALGRDRDWEGFDPTVLCNFRKRLIAHAMKRELFDTVLDRLGELGMLSNRHRVRVDATHLLSDVATLSRADSIREAIRVVVHDLYREYPQLREDPELIRLHDEYGEEVWLGGPGSGEQRLSELGRDGQALLELCGERPVRGKEVLAQMLKENFVFPEDGPPEPLDKDQRPDDHIVTPHEPDARVGKKGDEIWTGDKVHVTETADEERTNFILGVMSTDPRMNDTQALARLIEQTRAALPDADQLLADGGYASAENTKLAAAARIDLICPPRGSNSKGLIPICEFDIDLEAKTAICPEGHRSCMWSVSKRRIQIRFPKAACDHCPRRAECTTSANGRSLNLSGHYEQLLLDRERATTSEFKDLYARRAGVEATISHLVRDCGLRRSRYRGSPKRQLHAILSATGLNVRRLLQCLATDDTHQHGLSRAFSRRLWRLTDPARTAWAAILRATLSPARNLEFAPAANQ